MSARFEVQNVVLRLFTETEAAKEARLRGVPHSALITKYGYFVVVNLETGAHYDYTGLIPEHVLKDLYE